MDTILDRSLLFFCNIILLAFFIRKVESIPDDYCLTPLNRSNCGYPPTPVFQYYKSGSRCEIQFWRGCPTANLFRNEYDCSHHCIGRLWKSASNENTENDIYGNEELLKEEENSCDEDITTFKCTDRKQMIYTYDNKKKACVRKVYYGCATRNKFPDQERCEETCQKDKLMWKKINDLSIDELKHINDVLDKVNEDFKTAPHYTTQHKNPLKHLKNQSSDSAPAQETPSTSVETDKPTEVSTADEIIYRATEATSSSEITDGTTEATPSDEITDGTTEATPSSEITNDTTEATHAGEITETTTKTTKNTEYDGNVHESDIV